MTNFRAVFLVVLVMSATTGGAAPLKVVGKSKSHQDGVSYVHVPCNGMMTIPITTRGAVISLPAKPSKVVLGNKGAFGVEYVEADLAVTPIVRGARANLFAYVLGRRYAFDLRTTDQGNSIVVVMDGGGSDEVCH